MQTILRTTLEAQSVVAAERKGRHAVDVAKSDHISLGHDAASRRPSAEDEIGTVIVDGGMAR